MVEKILDFESTKDFLNNIDDNAYNLLNIWKNNPEITNDEKLATLFNVKVTIIRSILNKLSYRGIVTFDKVKDKNSGWYNYYWKLDFDKLAKLIYLENKEKLQKAEEKMNMANNYNLFCCHNNCKILPFELSAEYNFICPHCSEKLEYFDYSNKIKELENYTKQIKKEIHYIESKIKN